MQANLSTQPQSFYASDSPMALGHIFSPTISVAIWNRPVERVIQSYFSTLAKDLGQGLRTVCSMTSLREELEQTLPDGLGKAQAIEDVYLVADMLTCLFDCHDVGLRLVPLTSAMCPRFHVDNIPVRLVTTYCGPGTEWLPNEAADMTQLGKRSSQLYQSEQDICQLNAFDVCLLKGSAFDENQPPAIHRSCQIQEDKPRVLLTLDPL